MNPNLTVSQPADNQKVQLNQPFQVSGQVTDKGMPEPVMIDSVTVQVDGGSTIHAALKHIPDHTKTLVSFTAAAQVTGGQDPHTVVVTATNDQGISNSKTVSVFAGPVFQVDSPSVELDVIFPIPLEPGDPRIRSLVSDMQFQLLPLAQFLASAGKKLAGPNVISAANSVGAQVLRFGFWIEDSSFPVLPPVLPDFPLPVLLDQAAAEGINTLPVLDVPPLSGFSPAFAVSIPTRTLQKLVDVITPGVKEAASEKDVTLDSITTHISSPDSVTMDFKGSAILDIPFEVSVTEKIGTKPLPNADPPQCVPAVLGTSESSSLGGIPDFYSMFGGNLYAIFALKAGLETASQVNGLMGPLIAGIPTRIPFRNTALAGLPNPPDFPTLVPDWKSIEADGSGILGKATTSIQARDQSMVSMGVQGPLMITGAQRELAGGTGEGYDFTLANLAPDPGQLKWQVSGTGSDSGSIDIAPFDQGGSFSAIFPLPIAVKLGIFPFNLVLSATETCGTDPNKKLNASVARDIQIKVKKNPQLPP